VNARRVTNVAASVRQRLFNNAQQTARPFQEVLQYFAMERFLYRLSKSRHVERFVLKGALMFAVWHAPTSRPTKDIDFLARLDNSPETVLPLVREICLLPVEPDGIQFDPDTIRGDLIKEDADYEGLRVTFTATLGNARVQMQLDLGFGDALPAPAELTEYPVILDLPAPRLYGYNRETSIAEKFEAMVKLGPLNSRMKDFFDIWLLSRQFEFDASALAAAIAKTFERRRTALELPPYALTPAFATDPLKRTQWQAFLNKSRLVDAPRELAEIVDAISGFLLPAAVSARDGTPFPSHWLPPGPWTKATV